MQELLARVEGSVPISPPEVWLLWFYLAGYSWRKIIVSQKCLERQMREEPLSSLQLTFFATCSRNPWLLKTGKPDSLEVRLFLFLEAAARDRRGMSEKKEKELADQKWPGKKKGREKM